MDIYQYEYDFGDSWYHDIILEKIVPAEPDTLYPVCVDGQLACPPEDCGGIWGYYDILEVLGNPKHEEHEDYKEWYGEDLKPEEFDKDSVNKELQKFKKFRKL